MIMFKAGIIRMNSRMDFTNIAELEGYYLTRERAAAALEYSLENRILAQGGYIKRQVVEYGVPDDTKEAKLPPETEYVITLMKIDWLELMYSYQPLNEKYKRRFDKMVYSIIGRDDENLDREYGIKLRMSTIRSIINDIKHPTLRTTLYNKLEALEHHMV